MKYEEAKSRCANRGAIMRKGSGVKYYKNHSVSLDDRVPESDKLEDGWLIYDPREDDNSTLYMFND